MRRPGPGRWPPSAVVTIVGLVLAIVLVAGTIDPDGRTEGGNRPPGSVASASTSMPAATAPSPTPTSAPLTTEAAPPREPGDARAAVDTLVVASPDPALAPYRRDAFGGDWSYDPASGCSTRERVLIEESLVPPVVDDRCRSTGGRWRSAFDGVTVIDVADLQIDHLVPLADAWRSGAAAWTGERRLAFANDLTDPATLIAVTGSTNASKSDSPPDRWLPPDRSSWCAYATDWVTVKATWSLTVTPSEKATLVQVLAGC